MDFINLDLNSRVNKRFDPRRFVAFRDSYFDAANSTFLERIPQLTAIGTYQITDDPYRPDLISHAIYQDTQYWWLLMLFNDEISIEALTLGRKLELFSLSDLDELFFELRRESLPSTPGIASR